MLNDDKDYARTVRNLTRRFGNLWSSIFFQKCEVTILAQTRARANDVEIQLNPYESKIKDLYMENLMSSKRDVVTDFKENEEKFFDKYLGDKLEGYSTDNLPIEDLKKYLKRVASYFSRDEFNNPKPDTKLTREYIEVLKTRMRTIDDQMSKAFNKNKQLPDDEREQVDKQIETYDKKLSEFKQDSIKLTHDINEKRRQLKLKRQELKHL